MGRFTWCNPITIPGVPMRDHAIRRHDGRWWLTGTEGPVWTSGSPGVRLYVSDDLLRWERAAVLVDLPSLPVDHPCRGRCWAPELHEAHGRWWLTVNSGDEGPARRHGVLLWTAEAIAGPYTLVTPEPLGQGFKNDASLFTDDAGETTLYASGGGLWQGGIDLAAGRLTDGPDLCPIVRPTDPGLPEWMVGGIEGPCVVHRQGRCVMLFSAWTRGYEIGWLTAPTPRGPWTLGSREPVFGTRKRAYRLPQAERGGYAHLDYADTPDPFAETGHCSVFTGPDGNDWISCHYLPQGTHGRIQDQVLVYDGVEAQLGIEPVRFLPDGVAITGPTWQERTIAW